MTHLNIIQKVPDQSLQLKNFRNLWKKLTESEQNYKNIWITPPILGNGTSPTPPIWSGTLPYDSNSHNLVSGTGKHWRTLKEFNRIWKNYIRITPPMLGNGTFILLYSKVSNTPHSERHTSMSFKQPQF